MATAEQVKRADRKPATRRRASWVTRKDAILVNRVGAADDAEQGKARRTIVRLALGRHACELLATELCTQHLPTECTCPEPVCEDPRHETDVVDALAALKLLGLAAHEHVRRKFCPGCEQTKEVTEFSPNPRAAGGRRPTCKSCHRSAAATRREAAKRAAR